LGDPDGPDVYGGSLDPVPADGNARRLFLNDEVRVGVKTFGEKMRLLFACSLSVIGFTPAARADHAAMRLSEQAGAYRVTVFTSPTPMRAGTAEISVMVQNAASGDYESDARVIVRLTKRGTGEETACPATAGAATNKLLRTAVVQLPEPGAWQIEVAVDGSHGPVRVRFSLEVDPAAPRWLELLPWYGWPAVVVGLFSMHQVLVRRRKSQLRLVSVS
jgi:hypothetical protein